MYFYKFIADVLRGDRPREESDTLGCLYPSSEPIRHSSPSGAWGGLSALEKCQMRLGIASQLAQVLREQVFEELHLTTSAGVSVNKLLSKMVASANKPNKQTVLVPTYHVLGQVLSTDMPIQKVPGIGFSATRRWNECGVNTAAELFEAVTAPSAAVVEKMSKKEIARAAELCTAKDSEMVKPSGAPKSIGAEVLILSVLALPDSYQYSYA